MSLTAQKTCADCGEPWKMMCEPLAHRRWHSAGTDAVCHSCFHKRLDEDRKTKREAPVQKKSG